MPSVPVGRSDVSGRGRRAGGGGAERRTGVRAVAGRARAGARFPPLGAARRRGGAYALAAGIRRMRSNRLRLPSRSAFRAAATAGVS
jgi:hypothetical protein